MFLHPRWVVVETGPLRPSPLRFKRGSLLYFHFHACSATTRCRGINSFLFILRRVHSDSWMSRFSFHDFWKTVRRILAVCSLHHSLDSLHVTRDRPSHSVLRVSHSMFLSGQWQSCHSVLQFSCQLYLVCCLSCHWSIRLNACIFITGTIISFLSKSALPFWTAFCSSLLTSYF